MRAKLLVTPSVCLDRPHKQLIMRNREIQIVLRPLYRDNNLHHNTEGYPHRLVRVIGDI